MTNDSNNDNTGDLVKDDELSKATHKAVNYGQDKPTVGVLFTWYAFIGFLCVVGLFVLCLSADAMGRSFAKMGKRLLLADGSGHSSMLTEFAIFVLVLGVFCGMMAHAFSVHHSPAE